MLKNFAIDAPSGYAFLVAEPTDTTRIYCPGRLPQLSVTEEVEGAARTFTTTLTFVLSEPYRTPPYNTAILCRAADGTRYLIGTPHRPFPVWTYERTHASSPADGAQVQMKVTWKGPTPALLVVD